MGAIDDATGTIPAACFRVEADAAGYLWCLREIARTVGLPVAAYTDQHRIFVRNDKHWTRAEELAGAREPTQVGRAFRALGIQPIVARSPPAKGRIERLWGTLQDRRVAELCLERITTLSAAEAFLAHTFRPAFNAQFGVRPTLDTSGDPAGAAGPRPRPDVRLPLRAPGGRGQHRPAPRPAPAAPPGPGRRSYARAAPDVVQCLDGAWRVSVHDQRVAPPPAPPDAGQLRARKGRRAPPPAPSLSTPIGHRPMSPPPRAARLT